MVHCHPVWTLKIHPGCQRASDDTQSNRQAKGPSQNTDVHLSRDNTSVTTCDISWTANGEDLTYSAVLHDGFDKS